MDCFRGCSAGPKARLALWEIGIRVGVEGGREREREITSCSYHGPYRLVFWM